MCTNCRCYEIFLVDAGDIFTYTRQPSKAPGIRGWPQVGAAINELASRFK